MTNACLLQLDKSVIMTKICLCFVTTFVVTRFLSWQAYFFLQTKDMFCRNKHDKHVFVMTKCLSQFFLILLAAPASDIFVRRHGHTDRYYGEKWLLLLSGPKRLNREFCLAKVLHFRVLGIMNRALWYLHLYGCKNTGSI